MKSIVSLTLASLLISSLAACSPAPQGATPPTQTNNQTSGLSAAQIDAKVDLFNLMLLSKGADGVVSPITPERIESLRIDGKTVAPSAILQAGSGATESYVGTGAAANLRQQAAAQVVNGQPLTIFGGKGTYSFLIPHTNANSKLELKLKGDARSYQLIRFNNLSQGTFVLAQDGKIEGGFKTTSGFSTKSEGDGILNALQNIFGSPDSFFALAQFDIAAYVNFYLSNNGQVTVTTSDNQHLVFEPSNPAEPTSQGPAGAGEAAAAQQDVSQDLSGNITPLLGYIGTWTLESDLLKALIPGGALDLEVAKTGTDTYRLTAKLASGSYSGQGKHTGGSASDSELKLGVSAGDKSLEVKIHMVNANRVGITLTKAEGAAELSSFLNQEVYLKRKL